MKFKKGDKVKLKGTASETLERARKIYGNKDQIIVSAGEFCELSAIILNYNRYTHEEAVANLKQEVLGEVADAYICLEHVKAIFDITCREVKKAKDKKVARLKGWLDTDTKLNGTRKGR